MKTKHQRNMAQTIKTNGEIHEVQPKNGTDFQLEELQAAVEGYIQIIFIGPKEVMVVNEEGKFQCERNAAATILAKTRKAILPDDYISGNVLVCNDNQIK